MKSSEKINIAIVDDTPMRLSGFKSALIETGEINVVGTALNEKAFLKLCTDNENIIDVFLMDKHIERKSQIDDLTFIKEVRDKFPRQKIIIYTWSYKIDHIEALRQIKINGYLPDTVSANTMLEAIKTVLGGYSCFHVSEKDDKGTYEEDRKLDAEQLKLVTSLSLLQNKVAEFMANDMLNHQIAEKVGITTKAVENHVQKIYKKLLIFTDEVQPRSKFNHDYGGYFRRQ